METKHTPGPWIAKHLGEGFGAIIIVAPNFENSSQTGNEIACMDDRTYCHVGFEQMLADARLIASAPALLEACRIALLAFDDELMAEAGLKSSTVRKDAIEALSAAEALAVGRVCREKRIEL